MFLTRSAHENLRPARPRRRGVGALGVVAGVLTFAGVTVAATHAAADRGGAADVAIAALARERADATAASLQSELDGLTARIAQTSASADAITSDLSRSREALRVTAVRAFLDEGRDSEWAAVFGADELSDLSDRATLLGAGADAAADDIAAYQRLRDDTSPVLLRLADERNQLEARVRDAQDAALQSRAAEADAERAADEAEAAALLAAAAERAAQTQRLVVAQTELATRAARPGPAAAAAPVPAPGRALDPAAVQLTPPPDLPPAPPGGPTEEQWARLRRCESGGNYRAISRSGRYRGAYQFDQRTWEGIGGRGDPAAATPAEQDVRAKILHSQRGWRPWPVCGRQLIS